MYVLDTVIQFPGSTHDRFIWANISEQFASCEISGEWLLGGSGSCRSHSAIEWFSQLFSGEKRQATCFLRLFDDVGQGPTSDRKGKIVMSDLVRPRTAKG
ncbi:UNVERIFIED_CONTAM: hypothetical protein FKN15_052284 [Acipenser sinensis]